MSRPEHSPTQRTIADVFHYMYLASTDGFTFPDTLSRLLGVDVRQLSTLYAQRAPDPQSPTFLTDVQAIAALVGCAPAILAHLVRRWTPSSAGPEAGEPPIP